MAEYIDSRELIEKLEQLEAELDSSNNELEELEFKLEELGFDLEEIETISITNPIVCDVLDTISNIYNRIKELNSEIEFIQSVISDIGTEAENGVTLIPEKEFVEYCKELVEDCGYLPREIPWWIEIDWGKTARNIRVDYSEIEYKGTTYLFNC